MKKVYIFVLIFVFSILSSEIVFGAFISNSIAIKNIENTSYMNSITISENDEIFNLRINMIPGPTEPSNDFKIIVVGLPVNLIADGFTINSDTCTTGIKNISIQDNILIYTYTPNGNGSPCNAILTANYKTNSINNGAYNISYTIQNLNNNSLRISSNTARLNINTLFRIVRAETMDMNRNGFIDNYNLIFNKDIGNNILLTNNISISDNSNIATNLVFVKTGNSNGTLQFEDGIFATDNTPSISINTLHNGFEQSIYNLGIIEDKAPPTLKKVNSVDYLGEDITLNSPTNNFVFEFSENLREENINNLSINLNDVSVAGNLTLSDNRKIITFNPSEDFINSNYNIVFNSGIVDLVGNVVDISLSLVIGDLNENSPVVFPLELGEEGLEGRGRGGRSRGGTSPGRYINYENILNFSGLSISDLKKGLSDIFGTFVLDSGNIITKNNQKIMLKTDKKSVSYIFVDKNTSINILKNSNKTFFPLLQLDEFLEYSENYALVEGKKLKHWNISGFYSISPNLQKYAIDKFFYVTLLLKSVSNVSPFLVYHSKDKKKWSRIDKKEYFINKKNKTIKFKTNKLGYFLVIKSKYIYEDTKKLDIKKDTSLDKILENKATEDKNENKKIPEIEKNKATNPENRIDIFQIKDGLNEGILTPEIVEISNTYFEKLLPDDIRDYVETDPELRSAYEKYGQAYYDIFTGLEEYIKTKDPDIKKQILANIPFLANGLEFSKNLTNQVTNKDIKNDSKKNILFIMQNQFLERFISFLKRVNLSFMIKKNFGARVGFSIIRL